MENKMYVLAVQWKRHGGYSIWNTHGNTYTMNPRATMSKSKESWERFMQPNLEWLRSQFSEWRLMTVEQAEEWLKDRKPNEWPKRWKD